MFQGIQWEHIDYFNNAVICDLIEKVRQRSYVYLTEACK